MSVESIRPAMRQPLLATVNPRTNPNGSMLAVILLASVLLFLQIVGCNSDSTATGPATNNELFASVTVAASTDAVFNTPISSVPDADDHFIYFVANGPHGPGVFKVASGGGALPAEVAVGLPFSAPVDIALSTDNKTIFIADSIAGGTGGVFSVSINGGTPAIVPGTAGTMPVALDVIELAGEDHLFFCGTDASNSQKGVFEIASSGGTLPIVRYKGGDLQYPSGIASAKDGTLYVADRVGKVIQLGDSTRRQLAAGITMGTPPGIALTPDDKTVAVSSRSSISGTAQVTAINVATGSVSVFNKSIGSNPGAGGLHAARNESGATGVYGWCGISTGTAGQGIVYRIGL